MSKRNDDQLVLDTGNSERKKETSRKLYSIRMKASNTRLRRTTHD
ncbi:hypothetical protein ACFTRD_21600 [Paenibacillus sp. NPDC056933]